MANTGLRTDVNGPLMDNGVAELSSPANAMKRQKIIIDTDPGIGDATRTSLLLVCLIYMTFEVFHNFCSCSFSLSCTCR